MAKVGRNDPCPCGSSKKYKRCCGATQSSTSLAESDAPGVVPMPDRRALERNLADMTQALAGQEFRSPEEIDAYLQELLARGPLPRRRPTSTVEQAQDLMYDAWAAVGPQRVKLARKALQVSADCADAYVLLAEETARSLEEARDLYAKGVAAGERALGKEAFDEYAEHFWGVLETRPYMRARAGLAKCLWALGRRQEATEHLWSLLRLNPGDNQGLRYPLLSALLETGDRLGVQVLLDMYPEEWSATWSYGRALYAFQQYGDTRSTRALLTEARRVNPFVPAYLLGTKRIPAEFPAYVSIGDETEAIDCATGLMAAWNGTPGALAWLEQSEARATARSQPKPDRETVPKQMRAHFDALAEIIDRVCLEHLNEEYAQVCRRLAAALCRKRPSPVTRGRLQGWACGIVYTIGSVNFLFDRSQTPHLSAKDLCALFGVSLSTGSARATEIRKLFRMGFWDTEWCLPSKLDDNPLAWMISVNGLPIDARYAPPEIQQEALRKGLIPYLPEQQAEASHPARSGARLRLVDEPD
jgi:tetratricopeptide (TPR) repeat protein